MTLTPDGIVTKQLLKSQSGEFDIGSIHSINLHDAGVSDLGCLGECSCLERLNLSHNDVSRLHKLAGLTQLCTLNLSANRISSLEGLQTLDNLESLNLSGNLIGGLDCLMCLTGLEKLTELRLQDRVNQLGNPLCHNVNYVQEVQRMFPGLITLDGERLQGKGSELYDMCRQIDSTLEKDKGQNRQFNAPQNGPWVDSDYWQATDLFKASRLYDADQQLTDLLASCKKLTEQSEERLHNLQTEPSQSEPSQSEPSQSELSQPELSQPELSQLESS